MEENVEGSREFSRKKIANAYGEHEYDQGTIFIVQSLMNTRLRITSFMRKTLPCQTKFKNLKTKWAMSLPIKCLEMQTKICLLTGMMSQIQAQLLLFLRFL